MHNFIKIKVINSTHKNEKRNLLIEDLKDNY